MSFYGTYDQAGNVWEWTEALVTSSTRGARGGDHGGGWPNAAASSRFSWNPSSENFNRGFRVASIPEPSSWVCVGLVLLGVGAWSRCRRYCIYNRP